MSTAASSAGTAAPAYKPVATRKPSIKSATGAAPNGVNTVGIIVPVAVAMGAASQLKLTEVPPPTKEDESWLQQGTNLLQKYAKENEGSLRGLLQSVDGFGQSALNVGGDVAMAEATSPSSLS